MMSLDSPRGPSDHNRRFGLTFGRSRSEKTWEDRRQVTWNELRGILSTAPVGSKDGNCYTPAIFSGSSRKQDQAQQIDVVVLDADSGHSFDHIKNALEEKGWRGIVHSTHSHLTTQTIFAAGAVDKWMADNPGKVISDFMLRRQGYLPVVVKDAHVIDELTIEDRRHYIVQHNPCPKFRIVLPLAKPWVASNFDSQNLANAKWKERIGALASALDLWHDQSCVDTSRLFYTPRRRTADDEFAFAAIDGDDCPLWDLPDAAPAMPLMDAVLPTPNGHFSGFSARKEYVDNDGVVFDMTVWAASYASRFEIVTALRAKASEYFSDRPKSGSKYHIFCPCGDEHITGVDKGDGTFAVNASQLRQADLPSISSGFVIHCNHAGCAGKDRLDFLIALLRKGHLTIADLTKPGFLMPDVPIVDSAAIMESLSTRAPSKELRVDHGNIDPRLWADLPGALGLMHEWILATSLKKQPVLALGAIIAFAGTAVGQRVELERFPVRSNVYILAIANSGAGKDRPRKACKQMAKAAGLMDELIGVEEVASDSGIFSQVHRAPRGMILIDEVGSLISSANNRNAGAHLANVPATLLKLYSSSNEEFRSKSYANTENNKSVDQPCVSFYGTTTPRGLSESLTMKDISNGLLSRMVLFDSGDHDPRMVTPSSEAVPIGVIEWLQAWNKVNPNQNPLHRDGDGSAMIQPRVVMMTDEAHKMIMDFEEEMHFTKIAAKDRGTDPIYVRAVENACKFALIRACAIMPKSTPNGPMIDESLLRVDAQTMRWAIDLSRCTVIRMDANTREIADTPFEKQLKALRDAIKAGGENGKTMRELTRMAAGKHPPKLMADLLQLCTTAGDIEHFRIAGKGRPREAYVHKEYAAVHRKNQEEDTD